MMNNDGDVDDDDNENDDDEDKDEVYDDDDEFFFSRKNTRSCYSIESKIIIYIQSRVTFFMNRLKQWGVLFLRRQIPVIKTW